MANYFSLLGTKCWNQFPLSFPSYPAVLKTLSPFQLSLKVCACNTKHYKYSLNICSSFEHLLWKRKKQASYCSNCQWIENDSSFSFIFSFFLFPSFLFLLSLLSHARFSFTILSFLFLFLSFPPDFLFSIFFLFVYFLTFPHPPFLSLYFSFPSLFIYACYTIIYSMLYNNKHSYCIIFYFRIVV